MLFLPFRLALGLFRRVRDAHGALGRVCVKLWLLPGLCIAHSGGLRWPRRGTWTLLGSRCACRCRIGRRALELVALLALGAFRCLGFREHFILDLQCAAYLRCERAQPARGIRKPSEQKRGRTSSMRVSSAAAQSIAPILK